MDWKAEKIKMWSVEHLQPYERNAKIHTDKQVKQIAASITEYGFVNPILIDTNSGVIAGHGRLMAAKLLGMKTVPVIVCDHLDEKQKRMLIIADNKIHDNTGFNIELLTKELSEIEIDESELDAVGFTIDELKSLHVGESFFDSFDDHGGEHDYSGGHAGSSGGGGNGGGTAGDYAGSDDAAKPDTVVSIGEFRFKVQRDQYLAWANQLKESCMFDPGRLVDEIIRRLGI